MTGAELMQVDPALKTRWRRWLGQKTRRDKPYWTTLLDCNWLGWASHVLDEHDIDIGQPTLRSGPQEIKAYYLQAIECAGFWDLMKLDGLYAADLLDRQGW